MIAEKNPQVKKAVVRLMELSNDERTRMLNDSRIRMLWHIQGREQVAREEGEINMRIAIAKTMLADREPIDKILRYTSLTRAEIAELQNKL